MEDCDRISTTAHTSGIFSSRSSYADLDASIFDDDVFQARATTPLLARVPDEPWYMRLLSEWCAAWENVRNLWQTRDCWSKLDAMICFVLLPVRVIRKAASPHNHVTIPDHTSVCYLFLLMCYTFVLNLIEPDKGYRRREIFASACMVLAIAAMLYIYLFTKDQVRHDPGHDAPIRIFFRGGLYLFGFLSMLNSICLAYEDWKCTSKLTNCYHKSAATVQFVKSLFIVVETLFLGYFHKASFPLNTKFLQIFLAHILGTNLALWFWTLCEETLDEPKDQDCAMNSISNSTTTSDFRWRGYRKYFYPVFVEYLILALAILYGLWKNLRQEEEACCRLCKNCSRCLNRSQTFAQEQENNEQPHSFRQRYIPRCSFGMTFGTIYVAIFLFIMLRAIQKAENDKHCKQINITNQTNLDSTSQFQAYCGWSIVMYLSMISACYIILASLRSPNNLRRIRSIDYDDFLLYISLMGILLLEGFHVISKILTQSAPFYLVAVDISGTIQHLTQVVTLLSLSHCRGATSLRNRIWICECILFLFLTNLAWWIEDSFYLESNLTRPGEIKTIEGIEAYGIIVKPMVIFFRFHSATYFYNAWTIYKA